MDMARQWFRKHKGITYDSYTKTFRFPSGASLQFGYLGKAGDETNYQGLEYTFVGFDEAGNIPQPQLEFLDGRVRSAHVDVPPMQVRLTANPVGRSKDYLRDRYVTPQNSKEFFFLPSQIADNPHLDSKYKERLEKIYSAHDVRTMVHGDWFSTPDGTFFDRTNIGRAESFHELDFVRSWDLAATKGGGDYTVGALVGAFDGAYHVKDVVRGQWAPSEVDRAILRTAELDGPGVPIVLEVEPGSSGVARYDGLARALMGYETFPYKPSGDKVNRAKILASAVRNGLFSIESSASWAYELLDEFGGFPEGNHDDQVDAVSQAVDFLANQEAPTMIWV